MREPKTNKGITLIALIITIIVLLILAVVSIRLVINNGILGKAEHATQKYSESEADEQEQLLKSEYEMAKYEGKFSGTYPEYLIDKKYPGLKIGDYVAYNEAGTGTYTTDTTKGIGGSIGGSDSTTGKIQLTEKIYTTENLDWRVLGINKKGELELISDNPMSDDQTVYLANEEAYLYGTDELNTMCDTLYGNGTGSTGKVLATGARSLNVDDINKLGNYDPTVESSNYGKEWIYRYPTQAEMDEFTESDNSTRYMQYSKDGGTTWNNITYSNSHSDYQTFRMPGANTSTTIGRTNPGSQRITSTSYGYDYVVSNYVKQTVSDVSSMAEIITKGTGTSNINQWLASHYVDCTPYCTYFGIRTVFFGNVNQASLFFSNGPHNMNFCRIRPVVSLKSDVQIEKTETNDGSTLAKACIIK